MYSAIRPRRTRANRWTRRRRPKIALSRLDWADWAVRLSVSFSLSFRSILDLDRGSSSFPREREDEDVPFDCPQPTARETAPATQDQDFEAGFVGIPAEPVAPDAAGRVDPDRARSRVIFGTACDLDDLLDLGLTASSLSRACRGGSGFTRFAKDAVGVRVGEALENGGLRDMVNPYAPRPIGVI